MLLPRGTTKNRLQTLCEIFDAHEEENKVYKYTYIYISSVAIKCQRYHLAMRKFPGRRALGGGRGPWGDSARPGVTALPWHGPGQALLRPLPLLEPYQQKTQARQRRDARAKGSRHRG